MQYWETRSIAFLNDFSLLLIDVVMLRGDRKRIIVVKVLNVAMQINVVTCDVSGCK